MIACQSVHLVEGALIVIQPEPSHAIKDCLGGLSCRALKVGIFDPQDKFTAVPACVGP